MKFLLPFFSILFICLELQSEPFTFSLNAEGAILMNAKNGKVLFTKNADTPLYPASITKIATALYALKKKGNNLDEIVTIKREAIASITPEAKRQSNYRSPAYWLETDATHAGLKKGEEICLRDLFYLMLLQSANDAANAIAEHCGGTIPKFMEEVNSYLHDLGCTKTHFLNPHGLHHPEQVSTAREMAIIAREAMKNPLFRQFVSTVRYTVPKTNLEFEREVVQTNLLLRKGKYHFPGCTGIKTGTTTAAGKTLVAGASLEGRELIGVVMGCQKVGERYEDIIKMFNTAFHEKKMRRTLLPPGQCKLTKKVSGAKGSLKTYLPRGLTYDFYPSEEIEVKAKVSWATQKLPIKKGERVGIVRVMDKKGSVIQECELLAMSDLFPTLFYRLKMSLSKKGVLILFATGGLLALFIVFKVLKRNRRSSYS